MAVFLRLDGIAGESTDDRHAGEIDVVNWSLGVTNTGATNSGGGAGAGRATFTDLTVTKHLDRASPALLLAAATGRHLPSGTLTVSRGGHRSVDYLVVSFADVLVTAVLLSDTADQDPPTENLSLAYGQIHVTYSQQLPTGAVGSVAEFAWDLVGNAPG